MSQSKPWHSFKKRDTPMRDVTCRRDTICHTSCRNIWGIVKNRPINDLAVGSLPKVCTDTPKGFVGNSSSKSSIQEWWSIILCISFTLLASFHPICHHPLLWRATAFLATASEIGPFCLACYTNFACLCMTQMHARDTSAGNHMIAGKTMHSDTLKITR